MRDLLRRAGFKNVSSSRADCPRCKGHHGTVAYDLRKQVFNCHRCHWGGGTRSLEKSLGLPVTPETPEAREIRLREERREKWVSEKYSALAKEEYGLARRAELAKKVLAKNPIANPHGRRLRSGITNGGGWKIPFCFWAAIPGRAGLLRKAKIQ